MGSPREGFWVFTVRPAALAATGGLGLYLDRGSIHWFEARHERQIDVVKVEMDTKDRLRLRVPGGLLEAVPLTLDLYNRLVRSKTVGRVKVTSLAQAQALLEQEW